MTTGFVQLYHRLRGDLDGQIHSWALLSTSEVLPGVLQSGVRRKRSLFFQPLFSRRFLPLHGSAVLGLQFYSTVPCIIISTPSTSQGTGSMALIESQPAFQTTMPAVQHSRFRSSLLKTVGQATFGALLLTLVRSANVWLGCLLQWDYCSLDA